MRNKAEALRLLEEWPVDLRCTHGLIRGGKRCALGVMAGSRIREALRVNYDEFFGPVYGLTHEECWAIVHLNDDVGYDAAVDYVKGLPDDDDKVS